MKKIILIASLVVISFTNAISQKVYATKTGQISFDATGTCVDAIKAVNNQVDSKFVDKTGQIVFSVLIKGFKFANALMEDHFNENYMESTKFPKADFKGFITNISSVNFAKDGTYEVTAKGTLTIDGKSKEITYTGTLTIENGKPTIKSNFKVTLLDFIHGSYIGSQIASEAKATLVCKYE
jgi:polyisoprenoid-binding protein YceI